MHFWTLEKTGTRNQPDRPELTPANPAGGRPAGLLVGCSADCFALELLDRQLTPATWQVHHTAGNFVPAHGTGHPPEDDLIEQAVTVWGVRDIVVCGHWPCRVLARLLRPDAPAADVVGASWLVHAAVVRRMAADLPEGPDRLRRLVERNVRAQFHNLRTHPAVAVALERGRLRLLAWLHDDSSGELFFPAGERGRFDCRVACHPDHNAGLRAEQIHKSRPAAPPALVDPRTVYLA
jgi:carbonic anhydrase